MKPFEKMNHDVMQSNAMVSSAIIEDINGIETIKSLTSEEVRYQKIDSEMTRILTDEEEFDTNILKLKQEIDKLLNQ